VPPRLQRVGARAVGRAWEHRARGARSLPARARRRLRDRRALPDRSRGASQITIGDYLARPAPARRFDVGACNVPFDGGEEGAHVGKMLDECERVLALLPARSFHGRERYEQIWHRFDARRADRDWWLHRVVHLIARPKFGPTGGSDEIVLLDMRRVPGTCTEGWL
jgi:hypothetical protein